MTGIVLSEYSHVVQGLFRDSLSRSNGLGFFVDMAQAGMDYGSFTTKTGFVTPMDTGQNDDSEVRLSHAG